MAEFAADAGPVLSFLIDYALARKIYLRQVLEARASCREGQGWPTPKSYNQTAPNTLTRFEQSALSRHRGTVHMLFGDLRPGRMCARAAFIHHVE